MKHLSVFLDVIHRSGLAENSVINLALDEQKADNPNITPQQFAVSLVKKRILTQWQVEHLLQGKHKGFIVGAHKILKLIGRGGHASVYLAEHLSLKQNRVIKVVSQAKHSGTSMMDRFMREAQAAARLDHPNVIKCFDVVIDAKLSYIVMEYHPGEDLDKMIQRVGPLSILNCVDYTIQTAIGLQYTNASGLIHRDIKPSNLLLTNRGVVKILDLGLAMIERDDGDASLTQQYEDSLGTADYVAPEQAKNSHGVDFRADIYSLGCTLYHFLTGRPPFHEGSIMQRVAKHQTEMPPPITQFRSDCPKKLEAICWKMIQKNPSDRFNSYEELLASLNSLLKKSVPIPVALPNQSGSANFSPQLQSPAEPWNSGPVDGLSNENLPLIGLEALDTDPIDMSQSETLPTMPVPPPMLAPQASHTGALNSGPQPPMPSYLGNPANLPGAQSDPFMAATSQAPMIASPTVAKPKKEAEEEAYERFVKAERTKMIWIGIGLAVGLGVSIALTVVMNTTKEIEKDQAIPTSTHFED
ncbi:MAG: serine/threonine-protein kinase [Planctomycetota bacterium]